MTVAGENTNNIPKWIQAKLFENVLTENIENFKEIKEFKVKIIQP